MKIEINKDFGIIVTDMIRDFEENMYPKRLSNQNILIIYCLLKIFEIPS